MMSHPRLQYRKLLFIVTLFSSAFQGVVPRQCDPSCIPQRVYSAAFPMIEGTVKSYWWPEEHADRLSIGTSSKGGNHGQLHEIGIKLTPRQDVWSYEYNISSATSHISSSGTTYEKEMLVKTDGNPSYWAFNCENPPCGCPGGRICPDLKKEPGCSNYQLKELKISIDSPKTLQFRPKIFSQMSVNLGTLEHFDLKESQLYAYVPLVIKEGEDGELCIEIPEVDLTTNCTQSRNSSWIEFRSTSFMDFSVCQKGEPSERKSHLHWAWISILIVLLIVGVGALVYFVVRKKRSQY